ncbi:hypothetical protein I6F31_14360 [Bradyrhizobium sp. NBAIM01]|nr:hypothetical protein [Bradyrhizobium sp. NBAIM01]
MQLLAECAGYVDDLGQDEVQALMSAAFAPVETLPSDYAAHLVMRWELDDERDRWKWTGELPPARKSGAQDYAPEKRVGRDGKSYYTTQATIEAFHYVLSLGNRERLAEWLRNHPNDAPALLDTLEVA